jgi:hypothetical protein
MPQGALGSQASSADLKRLKLRCFSFQEKGFSYLLTFYVSEL